MLNHLATFTFPTRIVFGEGAARTLCEELRHYGISRPMVVTDRGLSDLGVAERVTSGIRHVSVFDEVQPNPAESDCLAGVSAYRARGCDGLVAIGGGSAIDAAKAIRLLSTHPGTLAEYDVNAGGASRITGNLPPMLAIPTTAGSGSEVGRAALIQLPQTHRKTAILSQHLLPSLAICDPSLTVSAPAELTAGAGMDALSHAIESYLSTTEHPLCDGIALESLRYVARGLEASVENGRDLAARRSMMMGALLGGVSFHKGLGLVHALSHALGSEGRAHHGTLNAILLPHVLRFNRPECEQRMCDLGLHFGLGRSADAAGHFITLVELLLGRLPLPKRLGEVHELRENRIEEYARLAMLDHCAKTNPRPATADDLVALLRTAW